MIEKVDLFPHLYSHPEEDSLFSNWLICEDDYRKDEDGSYKNHRKLNVRENVSHPFDEIVNLIKKHHISPERMASLERKKSILDKYSFSKYIEAQQLIPKTKKTQRGNLGEIILGEYLERVTANRLFIYRLRYNTNVEQSMKGDDVLLLNKEEPFSKVYTGEAKFRTTPNQEAVNDICKSYGKDIVRPLSIGFTITLFYDKGKIEEAEILEELLNKVVNKEVEIINIGLLLSNHNAARNVENHMKSQNKNFGIISLSMLNPAEFADIIYDRAFKSLGVEPDE